MEPIQQSQTARLEMSRFAFSSEGNDALHPADAATLSEIKIIFRRRCS